MNIADQLYYDFYTLLTGVLSNSFNAIVTSWQGTFLILAYIAMALIGYRQMFSSKPDIVEFFKHISIVIIVLVFVTNYDYMFNGLKFAFIDFPIEAGNRTINGIQQGIVMIGGGAPGFSNQDLSFEPTGSSTAFGAMWEFATTLADRVMAEAGLSNMRAYFVGGALYLVAVLLLVFQILIMAIGLLLGAACILAAPVFSWMIMFKPLKPMFEKWLTMGVGAGILLFFLIVVMGIILAFMGNAVMNVMGYNIFTQDPSQLNDPTKPFNAKEFTATMLFMAIAIKLLPKTENWASALSAFSVHGVMEAANTMGGYISDALKRTGKEGGKLGWEAAKKTGQGANKAASVGASSLKSLRDRMMFKRMETDESTGNDPKISESKKLNDQGVDLKSATFRRDQQFGGHSSKDPDTINFYKGSIKGDGFVMSSAYKPAQTKEDIEYADSLKQNNRATTESTASSQQRDATVNQNINQDVDVHNTENSVENDSDSISESVGSKERQETLKSGEDKETNKNDKDHTSESVGSKERQETLKSGEDSSSTNDRNRVGHDNMSRIDREQNAATKRLRNEVKKIQSSGASGEQAQAQLAASHQAEIQRVSDGHSGAELSKLKKNIAKEFEKLHKSLEADKPMKEPKKADRVESKDLKDE